MIVIEDALVILSGANREKRRAVGEHEIRGFLADEELLEDDSIAGAAESPLDHRRLNRCRRGGTIVDDHHALARGKAVGLQHERIAKRSPSIQASADVAESQTSIPRGRHVMARHEILGERLTRFERGRGLSRSNDRAAVGREHVDDPPTEWELRSDHCQVDALAAGDPNSSAGSPTSAATHVATTAIPGFPGAHRTVGDAAFARELPGHGVLARATADNEDLHEEQANCLPDRRLTD